MTFTTTSKNFAKKASKTLFVLALIGFITLLLVEGLLRITDPIGIKYFFENDRYFSILEPNDDYSYIHPANFSGVFQGEEIRTNSWGLRGPEFDLVKDPDSTRIIIIGDSVVLGWGASQESTFPMRLQKRLDNERRGVEIIPMGVSSWNTRNQYEFLKSSGFSLKPDILAMVIVPNDVVPKSTGNTAVPREELFPGGNQGEKTTGREFSLKQLIWSTWTLLGDYTFAVRYAQYFIRSSSRGKYFKQLDRKSPIWRDAELALQGIVDYCRENRIELVFFVYGSDQSLSANPTLELYKDYLESREFSVSTFPDELFNKPEYRISVADGHANDKGHVLIAETMYQRFESLLSPR